LVVSASPGALNPGFNVFLIFEKLKHFVVFKTFFVLNLPLILNNKDMGKSKWFSTTEWGDNIPLDLGKNRKKVRKPRSNDAKMTPYTAGGSVRRRVSSPQVPLSRLFIQTRLRLTRLFIAARYQANRYTGGIFARKTLLKMSVLVGLMYGVTYIGELPSVEIGGLGSGSLVSQEQQLDVGHAPKNWGTPNEAAPVSARYMDAAMVQDYVERFSKIAITEMEKYGVPASISLAQGLIESRAGHSTLARRNNNHFGIKCFSKRCKKGHCSNFTDDSHKDFFRVFKNPWESWREHSKMISGGRYARLKKHGRDYRKWAYGLKAVGYATDRTYADKLIGIIERYQLYRFDR
jgi:hypothetical protein